MQDLLKLQNGSDIRGVALEGVAEEKVNLSDETAAKIACAFLGWLETNLNKHDFTIAVGRDSRLSGPKLADAVIRGLHSKEGTTVRVYDFGYASTPSMFMATLDEELACDASIMITASHLPFNRNGLKFFTRQGGTDKNAIRAILTGAMEVGELKLDNNEKEPFNYLKKYADGLCAYIRSQTKEDMPFKGSKIIVDAGNGVGGFFAKWVLEPLGADTTGSVCLEEDGNFPNHIPNPEIKAVMDNFCDVVKREQADMGVIFDTDVDRAALVDKGGIAINRNRVVALLSKIVLEQNPGSTIVTDSVTSNGLTAFIEQNGGHHHRFKRGYNNVINESKRLNEEGIPSHLAMETSGHSALKENYFLDDGAYLIVKVLIKFVQQKKQGKTISDLLKDLKEPAESIEIRPQITADDFKTEGEKIISDLKAFVEQTPGWSIVTPNYEGVRVNCDKDNGNGWFLVRLSLHDPQLPINVESEDNGGTDIIKQRLLTFLKPYALRF